MTTPPTQSTLLGWIATGLRWVGGLGIVTIAISRCTISFSSLTVFDIDPMIDPAPLGGLGPAGSMTLDVLMLAASGLAILGAVLAGGRPRWWWLLLAVVPVPVLLGHGFDDFDNQWRGSNWLTSIVAAVALAHLGRDRRLRLTLAVLLLSVVAPLVVRGVAQVSLHAGYVGSEHADRIEQYEDNRETFLADQGWTPDSPAARIYGNRIRQGDPFGWFPTSNMMAAVLAAGVIFFGALAALRQRGRCPIDVISMLAAVGAGVILIATGSKGAIAAALLGGAIITLAIVARPEAWLRRHAGTVAVSLVVAAWLAVAFRGTFLPETFAGERSVLFRWHYLLGAERILAEEPWAGVGPGRFQIAYSAVRPKTSPEEVASAHNLAADYLASLGVSGAAWVALLGIFLWRAGRSVARLPVEGERPPDEQVADADGDRDASPRLPLVAAAVVAILGLVPALGYEAHVLAGFDPVARGVGIVLYLLLAATVVARGWWLRAEVVGGLLGVTAIVLLVHAQIEMTGVEPGSAAWLLAVVGLAAASGGSTDDETKPVSSEARIIGVGVAGLILFYAFFVTAVWAVPAHRAQEKLLRAASTLYPPAETATQRADQRSLAADILEAAYHQDTPNHPRLLELAARESIRAAVLQDAIQRRRSLDHAQRLARIAGSFDRPTAVVLEIEVHRTRLSLGDPLPSSVFDTSIGSAKRLTRMDPAGVGSWRRLGDMLWEGGEFVGAIEAYRTALECNENMYLDPLKQLADAERERLEQRIRGPSEELRKPTPPAD